MENSPHIFTLIEFQEDLFRLTEYKNLWRSPLTLAKQISVGSVFINFATFSTDNNQELNQAHCHLNMSLGSSCICQLNFAGELGAGYFSLCFECQADRRSCLEWGVASGYVVCHCIAWGL